MDEIKRDIKAVTQALYGEAIRMAETPDWWKNPTLRSKALQNIKTAICALRPNAVECEEIVDELGGALRLKYDDATEALLSLSLAQLALGRLDQGFQVEAEDELRALEAQVKRSRKMMP